MKQRITAAALVLLLLASAGCAQTDLSPANTADDTTVAPDTTAPAAETDSWSALEGTDLEGYDFRILNIQDFEKYIFAAEQKGETVNDAVFSANEQVMEKCGVKLSSVIVANTDDTFRQSVLSNEQSFDICMDMDINSANRQLTGGFMANLAHFPHIDWEKPWWPAFTTEALRFNDQIYMYSNYSSYLGNWFTRVVMCNLDLSESIGLEDPYKLVDEKRWTMDKWIELTSSTYTDLDGNGTRDYNDRYGFAMTGMFYCWFEGWNIELYQKDEAAHDIRIITGDDKIVNAVEKLYNWMHNNPGVYYSPSDSGNWKRDNYIGMFAAESAVYTYGVLGRLIEGVIDTDIRYAILPLPMLDESAGQYYSGTTDRPISVPVICENEDRTGAVIEAMAIAGYETILPAYRDSALKGRYATDADTSRMLDIIFRNRLLGFSYLYSGGYGKGGYALMLDLIMPQSSFQYASITETYKNTNTARVAEILSSYGIKK